MSENKFVVMVVNDVFDESLLIIKRKDWGQTVKRFDTHIKKTDLLIELEKNDIKLGDAVLHVVGKGFLEDKLIIETL